jgi:hypothetical protein
VVQMICYNVTVKMGPCHGIVLDLNLYTVPPPLPQSLFSGITSIFAGLFNWPVAEISGYVCSDVFTK